MRALAVFALLALAACAPRRELIHPTATPQQMARDHAECLALSRTGGATYMIPYAGNPIASGWDRGVAIAAMQEQHEIYEYCMLGRGYVYRVYR